MAKKTWIGGAPTAIQIATATVTADDAATTYTITVTGEDGSTTAVSVSGAGTGVNDTATAIRAAWNASTSKLCTGITASGSAAAVTLTSDTAGVPFYVASGAASGTGTFGAFSTTTANSGPEDYNCVTNWAEGSIPVATNTVTITGASSILYGLNQSAVEVGNFVVDPAYSGTIGGIAAALQIDVADASLFEFSGLGLAYFDFGASACAKRIKQTRAIANGTLGLYITGSGLGTIDIQGGSVRVRSGATATTINVGGGATCVVESGVTLANANNSGTLTLGSAASGTVRVNGGTATTEGSGTIATLDVNGGTAYPNSTGTITALTCNGGTTDFTKSALARTVTNAAAIGGTLIYDPSIVTLTNPPTGSAAITIAA